MNQRFKTWRRHQSLWIALAVVSMVGACRESPTGNRGATSKPASAVPAAANEARMLGVDAQDDAKSPACLPRSNQDGAWVKRSPIQVFGLAGSSREWPKDIADRLGHFRLASAARCVYTLPHVGEKPFEADVLLIEAFSPDDAYGILTCQSKSTELFKIGGETRVDRSEGLALHIWQGRAYIRLSAKEADARAREEIIRLALFIANRISREDLPGLLTAMPKESLRHGRLWLVRHLGSLPPGAIELAAPLDAERVSELLGLGKDTLVCLAVYEVPGGQRGDAVWVARYPSIKAAHDAFARYQRSLGQDPDALHLSTNLLPPQGAYLTGTWTAEEESMVYVLPRILSLLPS